MYGNSKLPTAEQQREIKYTEIEEKKQSYISFKTILTLWMHCWNQYTTTVNKNISLFTLLCEIWLTTVC